MKYLAILKDSLLEALDTKVFTVMIGLSSLVLLVVAIISYTPVSVDDDAERIAESVAAMLSNPPGVVDAPQVKVSASEVKYTDTKTAAWEHDYQFYVTVYRPGTDENNLQGQAVVANIARLQLRYLNGVKVQLVPATVPTLTRYEVTTKGSDITNVSEWPFEPTILFTRPIHILRLPVGYYVNFWESTIVNTVGASITLLISVIITAFFIPNMLRKGAIDLLLVKPIHRSTLLLYKYVGGLAFMFLNTSFVVVGIWLIMGLRTGLWSPGFLIGIPILTFQFAFYYSISTLFAVYSRSAIVSIMMTCLSWVIFVAVLGWGYNIIDVLRKNDRLQAASKVERPRPMNNAPVLPEWLTLTADSIHMLTPRLKDLDAISADAINRGTLPEDSEGRRQSNILYADISWFEAFGVTAIYIAFFLGLACWRFSTREY